MSLPRVYRLKPATTKPSASPPWRAAFLMLAVIGSIFLIGYRWTNELAAGRALPWSFATGLDAHIPFLSWTLLPYLSINLVYPLSFFLCSEWGQLLQHGKRLLAAQLTCFACFLAFPLSNERAFPALEAGAMRLFWEPLQAFDMNGNLAPSLHAALLVILRDILLRNRILPVPRAAVEAWSVMLAISTLTTWQHYLFDLVSGLLLGWICTRLFALPVEPAGRP